MDSAKIAQALGADAVICIACGVQLYTRQSDRTLGTKVSHAIGCQRAELTLPEAALAFYEQRRSYVKGC